MVKEDKFTLFRGGNSILSSLLYYFHSTVFSTLVCVHKLQEKCLLIIEKCENSPWWTSCTTNIFLQGVNVLSDFVLCDYLTAFSSTCTNHVNMNSDYKSNYCDGPGRERRTFPWKQPTEDRFLRLMGKFGLCISYICQDFLSVLHVFPHLWHSYQRQDVKLWQKASQEGTGEHTCYFLALNIKDLKGHIHNNKKSQKFFS